MFIVVGDIGGTNCRLQLWKFCNNDNEMISEEYLKCSDYANFDQAFGYFIKKYNANKINYMCIGVAGRIVKTEHTTKVSFTNIDWQMNSLSIKELFDIDKVAILNDFEVIGYSSTGLDQKDIMVVQNTANSGIINAESNKCFIGPGTGLGLCFVVNDKNKYHVYSSEYGHSNFAAGTPILRDLLDYLYAKMDYVSTEDILSGRGILKIFGFYLNSVDNKPELFIKLSANNKITPEMIVANYDNIEWHNLAKLTVDTFLLAYASVLGNVATQFLPYGGIYMVGSISSGMKNLISDDFLIAMRQKGLMSDMVSKIPVYLVTNKNVGLIGSLEYVKHHMMPKIEI